MAVENLKRHKSPGVDQISAKVIKGIEVTGEWRKLQNEEHNDLYTSQILYWWSNQDELGGASCMYGGEERCTQGFGGPLGRPGG